MVDNPVEGEGRGEGDIERREEKCVESVNDWHAPVTNC